MLRGRSRYGVKRAVDGAGRSFASGWERTVAGELQLRERIGEIRDLRMQVWYHLEVAGVRIESYVADFVYFDVRLGREVVADAKRGLLTPDYRRKRKWMRAAHGIEILEITPAPRARRTPTRRGTK